MVVDATSVVDLMNGLRLPKLFLLDGELSPTVVCGVVNGDEMKGTTVGTNGILDDERSSSFCSSCWAARVDRRNNSSSTKLEVSRSSKLSTDMTVVKSLMVSVVVGRLRENGRTGLNLKYLKSVRIRDALYRDRKCGMI